MKNVWTISLGVYLKCMARGSRDSRVVSDQEQKGDTAYYGSQDRRDHLFGIRASFACTACHRPHSSSIERPGFTYMAWWFTQSGEQRAGSLSGFERTNVILVTLSNVNIILNNLKEFTNSLRKVSSKRKLNFSWTAWRSEIKQSEIKDNVRQLREYNETLRMLAVWENGTKKGLAIGGMSTGLYQPLDFDSHEIRLLVDWADAEDAPILCSLELLTFEGFQWTNLNWLPIYRCYVHCIYRAIGPVGRSLQAPSVSHHVSPPCSQCLGP
jgi:hypothetical protein